MKVDFDDLLIRQAIELETEISFEYQGTRIRVAEPHAILTHKESDVLYLLAYQVAGYSTTITEGWKLFLMYNIYDCIRQDTEFKPKNYHVPAWSVELFGVWF